MKNILLKNSDKEEIKKILLKFKKNKFCDKNKQKLIDKIVTSQSNFRNSLRNYIPIILNGNNIENEIFDNIYMNIFYIFIKRYYLSKKMNINDLFKIPKKEFKRPINKKCLDNNFITELVKDKIIFGFEFVNKNGNNLLSDKDFSDKGLNKFSNRYLIKNGNKRIEKKSVPKILKKRHIHEDKYYIKLYLWHSGRKSIRYVSYKKDKIPGFDLGGHSNIEMEHMKNNPEIYIKIETLINKSNINNGVEILFNKLKSIKDSNFYKRISKIEKSYKKNLDLWIKSIKDEIVKKEWDNGNIQLKFLIHIQKIDNPYVFLIKNSNLFNIFVRRPKNKISLSGYSIRIDENGYTNIVFNLDKNKNIDKKEPIKYANSNLNKGNFIEYNMI